MGFCECELCDAIQFECLRLRKNHAVVSRGVTLLFSRSIMTLPTGTTLFDRQWKFNSSFKAPTIAAFDSGSPKHLKVITIISTCNFDKDLLLYTLYSPLYIVPTEGEAVSIAQSFLQDAAVGMFVEVLSGCLILVLSDASGELLSGSMTVSDSSKPPLRSLQTETRRALTLCLAASDTVVVSVKPSKILREDGTRRTSAVFARLDVTFAVLETIAALASA
eukprot:Blabericola_migrator_1__7742@NODE_3956_length_1409_cov_310_031297_g2444_i0_p1_GENE_NODE_3956_length_1409_cov_310_031297_g2444_i0NODE_3956_length_1409_cov_310_031297_g2444_i0_p1_ORF_typecomplete_len220_score30_01_NODE_3956_length_1409_cov_310_031297_g2444_i03951054